MKKYSVFKIAAAFVVVLAFAAVSLTAIPANAAGSGKITIKPNGQSTDMQDRFKAYQVFKGDAGTENTEQLSNIEWGSGVNSTNLLAAMKSSQLSVGSDTFGTKFTAAWNDWNTNYQNELSEAEFVAQWLAEHVREAAYANAFARIAAQCLNESPTGTSTVDNGNWVINDLEPGYYLVVDTYASASDGETGADESVSSYILEVIGSVETELKATLPTVDKKVDNQDGSLVGTDEVVKYTLTGTVAENIAEYKTYEYKFVDNLSKGLTVDENSVKVQIRCDDLDLFTWPCTLTKGEDTYTTSVTDGADGAHVLTISFTDLKKTILDAWQKQVTDGHWKMTPNLADPMVADKITVVVTYTAKLNEKAVMGNAGNTNDVSLEYSNDPYEDGTGKTDPSTPDEVKTYSLALKIDKNDENGSPLQGVKFKLKNSDNKYATLTKVEKGAADSSYPDEAYYAITGWVDSPGGDEFETDAENGAFNIHGLELGTYTLEETATAEGYELMKPLTFTITANNGEGDANNDGIMDSDGTLSASITIDQSTLDDSRSDVEWNSGSFDAHGATLTLRNFPSPILPYTGSIGAGTVIAISLIVLLIGSALVVFAVQSKRKNNHANNA